MKVRIDDADYGRRNLASDGRWTVAVTCDDKSARSWGTL
jgi:hypothetical protein